MSSVFYQIISFQHAYIRYTIDSARASFAAEGFAFLIIKVYYSNKKPEYARTHIIVYFKTNYVYFTALRAFEHNEKLLDLALTCFKTKLVKPLGQIES